MVKKEISHGTVHKLPLDLRNALMSSPKALLAWEDVTVLSRNEWICWATSVKKEETRRGHVKRVVEELVAGKRRPCCWIGCVHRKDKKISKTQKFMLAKRATKKNTL